MRKVGVGLALAALAAACSSSSTSVSPDGINGPELAAVRSALSTALASASPVNDSFYSELSIFVFPFVDRASRIIEANGDTTRLVGIQLDISATESGTPVVAQFSAVLGWRGYRAARQTVDSVFFLLGAGVTPPLGDSLSVSFSPDSAGSGTGWVIAQAADSGVTSWLTRTGAFHVSGAAYGAAQTTSSGGLTLAASHGSMNGDYHLTAELVPDSATAVSAGRAFAGGIDAVKIRITGSLSSPPAPTR